MTDEIKAILAQPTTDVPTAGRVFYGLSRDASYKAAKTGELPTVRIGRLLRVPTAPVARKLGLDVAGQG